MTLIDHRKRNFLKLPGHGLLMLYGMPLLTAVSAPGLANEQNELERIRKQLIEVLTAGDVSDDKITELSNSIKPDGTWDDINYASERGGNWETRDHLKQLELMAKAFQKPSSAFFQQPRLADQLKSGLGHWADEDYQNYNWWQMQIGVPMNVAHILILLDRHVPENILKASVNLLQRSEVRMTGQNRVWLSGIVFMRGLLTHNDDDMARGAQAIWSELRISNEEGIQLDYSFHQHGPQLQFGNYGRSFGESMVMWASALRKTKYAMPGEKVRILGDYLLNGPRWSLWNGQMDFNACGRQFSPETPGNPTIGYVETRKQLAQMQFIDDQRSDAFRIASEPGDNPVGHRSFWRTAFAIHRRPTWYSSVRMSSTHVIGTETANYENMQGRLLGDGCHLTLVSGDEYANIAPLWNWRRLPGITADQRIIEVYPTSFNTEYGRSAFAGGLSAGDTGVSAMTLMREGMRANKAWFFEHDAVVCLGADIEGYSHGDVYSSIQQSHHRGDVVHPAGKLAPGQHAIPANTWLHHDNIGYQLLTDCHCSIESVESNWQSIFPKYSDIPAKGHVFSLWINHGKSPRKQDYAYVLYPNTTSAQLPRLIEAAELSILANNDRLAAIESTSGIKAVFFRPSQLESATNVTIAADKACILSLSGNQLIVCDPARQYEIIELVVNGKTVIVDLPQGEFLGSQVMINL